MKKWKKIKNLETRDYGGFYQVEKDEVLAPGGKKTTYSVVRHKGASMTIPIDSEGNVYLVKQHRYPINRVALELPCGCVEKTGGISTAKRELEEETGLVSDDWEKVGSHIASISNSDLEVTTFIAHNVKKVKNPRQDPFDKDLHEIEKYSLKEVQEMIQSGEIFDGTTIVGFSIALFQGKLDKYLKEK